MNRLMNHVRLIGYLGTDPIIRNFENGRKLASMPLATKEVFTDKHGNKQSNTHWHKLVAWGNTALVAERMLTKGKNIAVTGKLNNRSFEDTTGKTRQISEIVVSDLLMI